MDELAKIKDGDKRGLLNGLQMVAQWEKGKPEVGVQWARMVEGWKNELKRMEQFRDLDHKEAWNFSEKSELADWYAHGNGVTNQVSPAGEFRLHAEGDKIVERIFPRAIVANALSGKHIARLTSRDIHLDGD